ncbi:MAG: hypothetical protein JW993_00995 [Sedimentisphaerales bacterium]|nr:hypothetical protein [Sedimentisphaerales bacterium]
MERESRIQIVAILSMVMLLNVPAWGKYGGGRGTATDPYLIYTAADLKALGQDRGNWGYCDHYRLMADIDLAGVEIQPFGTNDERFVGIFHGNGKTVSNLKMAVSSGNYVGLFGCAEAEIRDLRLVNVEINAPQSTYVGALAGWAARTVERCCVEGGMVSGLNEVGGLVGENGSQMSQCYTTCNVSGDKRVGGLLGESLQHAIVSECFSTASVSGTEYVGGLVGGSRGVLKDCYATGQVNGTVMVGGLIGSNRGDGLIWNCYAAGPVHGNAFVGGLCGFEVVCYRSFWDMETTRQSTGYRGVGLTTTQMRSADTFPGWGRSGAWTIDEGNDYPRLAWESRPGSPLTAPAFPDVEGAGTADSPYLICTNGQLNAIGDCPGEWDRYYRLESDLDLAELDEPFRLMGYDQLYFTGTFDGNGHSIANFECPYAGYGVGMFACTLGAMIRRVTLVNPYTEQNWSISSAAWWASRSKGRWRRAEPKAASCRVGTASAG